MARGVSKIVAMYPVACPHKRKSRVVPAHAFLPTKIVYVKGFILEAFGECSLLNSIFFTGKIKAFVLIARGFLF